MTALKTQRLNSRTARPIDLTEMGHDRIVRGEILDQHQPPALRHGQPGLNLPDLARLGAIDPFGGLCGHDQMRARLGPRRHVELIAPGHAAGGVERHRLKRAPPDLRKQQLGGPRLMQIADPRHPAAKPRRNLGPPPRARLLSRLGRPDRHGGTRPVTRR